MSLTIYHYCEIERSRHKRWYSDFAESFPKYFPHASNSLTLFPVEGCAFSGH